MNPLDPTVERMTKIIDRMRLRAKEKTIKMEVIEPHDYDPQPLARDAKEMNLEDTARDIFAPIECVDVEVGIPLKVNNREFFNLDERVIEKAEEEGKNLRFTWPNGSSMYTPSEWRTNAQLTLKEFKFAGNPMRLLGNYLSREDHE